MNEPGERRALWKWLQERHWVPQRLPKRTLLSWGLRRLPPSSDESDHNHKFTTHKTNKSCNFHCYLYLLVTADIKSHNIGTPSCPRPAPATSKSSQEERENPDYFLITLLVSRLSSIVPFCHLDSNYFTKFYNCAVLIPQIPSLLQSNSFVIVSFLTQKTYVAHR